MRQREFRESSKSTSSVGGASARRHDKATGAFEGQILEEVDEEEEIENEEENEPGESTPALEALRLACAEAQQQQQQQLVTDSKYSSMVQFRAPDIIEL